MTLPVGTQAVTVTDTRIRPDGTPDGGTIRFVPSPTTIAHTGSGTTIAGTVVATLDAAGHFSVALLATDSSGINPTGWTYTVTEDLTSGSRRPYAITLPAASPTVTLAALAPVAPAGGTAITVGPAGPQGVQGPAGADGWGTQSTYDTLAARVAAVESGFTTVNAYITDALNRVASLETRMTSAEARLTALETP